MSMYLGIDIGGTKTLVATFGDDGIMQESLRFETPKHYKNFLHTLAENVAKLSTKRYQKCCAAVPGMLDRSKGIVTACGNLPWKGMPIQKDITHIVGCTTLIENDANLAGLSEALLVKQQYERIFYLTISTGIGGSYIVDGVIDPDLIDSEVGLMVLEYHNKLQRWQDFASGKAITERFGKKAIDIHDAASWKIIAHALGLGIIDIIATVQPDALIFGGGVSKHFERLKPHLEAELKKYDTPLTPIPPLIKAQYPDEAVIYGCYNLIKKK